MFESEDDDEGITLSYGTTDDIDDVIDFYEDMFEDNELTVDDSDDGGDEYYAEGKGDGFKFEINAEEARGEYEERAFATVVEVKIEYYTLGEETLEKMQGFWLICGAYGEVSDDYRMWGQALEVDGMKMDFYDSFEIETTNVEFTFVDEATINYFEDGEEYTVDISFETVAGVYVMAMTIEDVSIYLEESSVEDMAVYEDMLEDYTYTETYDSGVIYLGDYLTDAELEFYVSDLDWYLTYIYYTDGTYEYADLYNRMYMDSYYNGIDEYEDVYYDITWYVYDGYIYFIYEDGSTDAYLLGYEYDGAYAYLYLFDPDLGYSGNAWVYTVFGDEE